ncbi:MAG TPA: alkaline phosphatase family protein [Polyangiaceae bacterium]
MMKRWIGCATALGLVAAAGCGSSGDAASTGTGGSSSSGAGGGQGGASSSSSSSGSTSSSGAGGGSAAIEHVFLILMENHNWGDIKGSASAPYLNGTLLPMGGHAEQYFNPKGNHPSEPNYLWLEAGTNFGIKDDSDPATNHQSTKQHLVTLLEAAGHTWKSYQEDIPGTDCPLKGVKNYAPKHNPMVFFDDVTGTNDAASANCIAKVRPYTELATDLAADTVPNYAFITPNLCNDGHNSCPPTSDQIKQSDDWLAKEVKPILLSNAYKKGVVIITWDESELGDFPIGWIVLSPFAKAGYSNSTKYTHSSTLRSVQEIFGVSPLLGDAANATDLKDFFTTF